MKIKSLILLAIFSTLILSCEKDMKWINPDDSKADQAEILKICEEKNAECGQIEYEYAGKMRNGFCGECRQAGYECNSNKCQDIDECADPSLNNCNNEVSTCANEEGTYSCICKENYSGDDCVPDTRLEDCEGLPENAAWNRASRIEQTWNGYEWSPSNKGFFSEEASESECRFKCLGNYTWKGSQCVADTKKTKCYGLPENAWWNTVSEITQTWNGSEWMPSNKGTYNEKSSITECRFKCNEHYNWDESTSKCAIETQKADCSSKPANSVWNDNGANGKFTQTWTDSGWGPAGYESEYSETAGVCKYICDSTHTWEGGSCINQKNSYCPAKPANTVWNDNGANGTYTQTWNSSSGWSSSYSSSYSEASGICKYKCDSTHTWEGGSCINQKTANCPSKPANTIWNDNGANGTYTQTWNSSNGWSSSYSSSYNEAAGICKYKCDSTHYWHNSECTNPCDYEPCDEVANSTKICTASAWNEYSCGCENGYFWDGSTCKKYLSLGNICTGQNKCYNNSEEITCQTSSSDDFFGQDAQYASHGICTAQSLTASSNVVVDNNTGLTWEKTLSSDTYTWYNRAAHCNELNSSNYGGKSNWRVPNLLELLTIIDISNNQPATNSNFTGMPTSNNTYLWTDNGYKGNNSYAYFINPYLGFNLYNEEKTNTNKVLCVSGDELVPATSSDFTTSSDGKTVTDRRTGLMWQKEYATGKTWQQALKYCEDSTYAGNSDWRLPNKNELASLINYGIYNPASDFPDMPSSLFWSSSTYGHGGNAWFASFQYGYVDYGADKTGNLFNARCVRSENINDPCENHTCESMDHSSGICVPANAFEYSCECNDGYFWDGTQCINPCDPNPCSSVSNSNKVCTALDWNKYTCGCKDGYFWDETQCINPCNPNPCNNVSNSDKVCTASAWNEYTCGCESGYHWLGTELGCTDEKLSLGNICTGQNKCYNNEEEITCPASPSGTDEEYNFYGQDAQHTNKCMAQSFTVSSDVIVDNNTGLTWEKSPSSDTYTWDNRAAHCNELNSSNFGGRSNWRVPNPLEFLTIVDNSIYNLATNSNFTNMPAENDSSLWTNSEYKGDPDHAYHFIPYYGWSWYDGTKTDPHKVLCVSGEEMKPAVSDDFTISSDGKIVTDSRTGLMWKKEYETNKTWQQALEYCQSLNAEGYGGYSTGWRLPNKNELASLINYEKSGPPYSYFPDMSTNYFLSSSTYVGSLSGAWIVHFYYGLARSLYKTAPNDVLCVR